MSRPTGQVGPFHVFEVPTMVFVDSETVVWELTYELDDHQGPAYAWPAGDDEQVDLGSAFEGST